MSSGIEYQVLIELEGSAQEPPIRVLREGVTRTIFLPRYARLGIPNAMQSEINQAIQYIKAHWKGGKTLKEIAQMHGVDSGNLARAFKAREGRTAKDYIHAKRKEQVLRTLNTADPFGYEIATQLGFANEISFYRWAKRAFGITFSQLKTENRDKKR